MEDEERDLVSVECDELEESEENEEMDEEDWGQNFLGGGVGGGPFIMMLPFPGPTTLTPTSSDSVSFKLDPIEWDNLSFDMFLNFLNWDLNVISWNRW